MVIGLMICPGGVALLATLVAAVAKPGDRGRIVSRLSLTPSKNLSTNWHENGAALTLFSSRSQGKRVTGFSRSKKTREDFL